MSLLLLFNPALQRTLLDAARGLQQAGHPNLALVVAQTACELAMEQALADLLSRGGTPQPVADWIDHDGLNTYSPKDERVQRLYRALSGTDLKSLGDPEWWRSYVEGAMKRNDVVHKALAVADEEATRFIEAANRLIDLLRAPQGAVIASGSEDASA